LNKHCHQYQYVLWALEQAQAVVSTQQTAKQFTCTVESLHGSAMAPWINGHLLHLQVSNTLRA
ncbi:MAG: hypothetical protein WCI27_08865, partial [Candidatus Omnitrophota bacterium]